MIGKSRKPLSQLGLSVESLNVSVASGVCLFEAVRQRAAK